MSQNYTRLERAVIQALSAELQPVAPDLARQFATAKPTVRRNSGFGLFTEVAVPPAHVPAGNASGDWGEVHVMVAGLKDPVRFTARLHHGRLMGLMGDSYGQPTGLIDFNSVHFTQIFTVDANGRSIPVQVSTQNQPTARPAPPRQNPGHSQRQPQHQASTPVVAPAQPRQPQRQSVPAATAVPATPPPARTAAASSQGPLISSENGTAPDLPDGALKALIWVAAVMLGGFINLMFDSFFGVILGLVAANWATNKHGFPHVRRAYDRWRESTFQAGT